MIFFTHCYVVMNHEHLQSLLASRTITRAQYTKLADLVARGITDPCTHADVTPACAQLFYKHAAPVSGEGASVTKVKLLLSKVRSEMRDNVCAKLSMFARNAALDAYLGEWLSLDMGSSTVDLLTGIAWKWLEYAGASPGGNFLDAHDTLPPAVTVESARENPEQLMISMAALKKSMGARYAMDPCHAVDTLALRNGWWTEDSVSRRRAIPLFIINNALIADEAIMFNRAATLVQQSMPTEKEVEALLEDLIQEGRLKEYPIDEGIRAVAPIGLHKMAESLIDLVRRYLTVDPDQTLPFVDASCATDATKAPLTEEQAAIFDTLVTSPTRKRIVLSCAPAGTGKTETASRVAACYGNVLCLAPTWKAISCLRKRMNSSVVFQTVQSFYLSSSEFCAYDLVIVDELSMVTMSYIITILQSFVQCGTQILLMGDDEQLPCIGRGSVIRDLTLLLPIYRLTKVLRTDAVHISALTAAVRSGTRFSQVRDALAKNDAPEDEVAIVAVDESAAEACGINAKWSSTPWASDFVQVISHTNADVAEVNKAVQSALKRGGAAFSNCYIGDAVRCTVNTATYKNGTEGILVAITESATKKRSRYPQTVGVVKLEDGKEIEVQNRHMEPAYACTVHKSQGSEYPGVILYVTYRTRLSKELLYTAVTRAKRSIKICGRVERLNDCPPERRMTIVPFLVEEDD